MRISPDLARFIRASPFSAELLLGRCKVAELNDSGLGGMTGLAGVVGITLLAAADLLDVPLAAPSAAELLDGTTQFSISPPLPAKHRPTLE